MYEPCMCEVGSNELEQSQEYFSYESFYSVNRTKEGVNYLEVGKPHYLDIPIG